MLSFFRFVFGYILVEISGETVENLLNIAAKNRIIFWDLSYNKGKIFGKMGIKDFKKIRNLRKIKMHKIKIIKKCGAPFFINKNSKRLGFLTGFLVFCGILLFFSNFIWCINVIGNKNVSNEEIISKVSELSIKVGTLKSSISPENAAQSFLMNDKRFAWCAFNVEGCVLNINVTETKNQDKSTKASNIIAADDGIIKKIDVTSGTVMCHVGDIVNKGELLVSGIEESTSETVFVRSRGTIIAETEKEYSQSGKYLIKESFQNGRIVKRGALEAFGLKMPLYLGKVKGNYSEVTNTYPLVLWDNKMPFCFYVKEYKMLDVKTIKRSEEKLEKILKRNIAETIKAEKNINAEKLSEEVINNKDGITVKEVYKITKNIALEDVILIDTKN